MHDASLLAIVVPAYRKQFLSEALRSIVSQSDQRFSLYVFDDASGDDLRSVFEREAGGFQQARFTRFENNLGRQSLVQQWNRCVQATANEPWVWVFADDDVMESNCVAEFHRSLSSNSSGVTRLYRFNSLTIDDAGDVIRINPPHPPSELAIEFAYHRMAQQRRSFVSDHVFRRAAFDEEGGFVDLPFALGSDDASWIRFTKDAPIQTIESARIWFRDSGANTSSVRSGEAARKLCALCDFAEWIRAEFDGKSPLSASAPSKIHLAQMATAWGLHSLRGTWEVMAWKNVFPVARHAARALDWPLEKVLLSIFTPSWESLRHRISRRGKRRPASAHSPDK